MTGFVQINQAVDILGLELGRKIWAGDYENHHCVVRCFSIVIQGPFVYSCTLPSPRSPGNGMPNHRFNPASLMILKHAEV